jgi:hypothetical protein
MTKLRQLAVQIFVNGIKLFLELFFAHVADRIVCWVVIYIWEKYGLREWWSDMLARAAITVTASANLGYA